MCKIKFIIIVAILYLCSCSNKIQDLVRIKQIDSDYPIFIGYNKPMNGATVSFPIVFSMSKKTMGKIKLPGWGADYYYKNTIVFENQRGWGLGYMAWGGAFFKNENNILKLTEEEDRVIPYFGKKEYITYTLHSFIMSDTAFQSFVEIYKDKIPKRENDTIHIGSIQEWKKNNPELLNTFLKGDSIRIEFEYDGGSCGIALPVEIR